jgi:AcrR family transcriptional regulator
MKLYPKKEDGGARQAILDAACRVFARHSYHAASIRAIATEGGFGHALIGYYFPTKADLFRAVAETICDDLRAADAAWLEEVRPMNLRAGLRRYVERLIEYSREKPWVLRIIMLNVAGGKVGAIPGRDRLIEAFEGMRTAFADRMGLTVSREEVGRFSHSFNALINYYLGAAESAAWLLRMDPDSPEYFEWVRETLVSLFLPMLRELYRK